MQGEEVKDEKRRERSERDDDYDDDDARKHEKVNMRKREIRKETDMERETGRERQGNFASSSSSSSSPSSSPLFLSPHLILLAAERSSDPAVKARVCSMYAGDSAWLLSPLRNSFKYFLLAFQYGLVSLGKRREQRAKRAETAKDQREAQRGRERERESVCVCVCVRARAERD